MNLAAVIRSRFQIFPYFQRTAARSIANWNNVYLQYYNPGKCSATSKQLSGLARPLWNSNLLLLPHTFNLIPSCGMKVKGIPKLRCKDCYYIRKEGRLHVQCDSHPRHKQMEKLIKKSKTLILSHACMSKERSY